MAFKDDNGWNVTKLLNKKNSDKISIYIEGNDITEAYVITSLMKSSTPSEYGIIYSLDELVSVELSYIFTEGYTISLVEESDSNLLVTPLAFAVVCMILGKRKKRRKSVMQNV